MALGRRRREVEQPLFVATERLVAGEAHPFYRKLNELLGEAGFDRFVEELCLPYYKRTPQGRPSIPPGVFFRMLFVGYFEGIDSQRGIAWRCQDSNAVRRFLGVPLDQDTPDHSSLTRVRERLPQEVHDRVFEFVLKLAVDRKLLGARTVGVDSTTLEANAAMKSIVRRDTGEDYREFVRGLAKEAGIEKPTAADLQRFDRERKDKTCSNEDWASKTDPSAEITKMKDGRTRLAYKAEHVVDLASEFVLAAEVTPATAHDGKTMMDSVLAAQAHLDAAAMLTAARDDAAAESSVGAGPQIRAVAADKGYHSAANLEAADDLGYRTYAAEPKRTRKRKSKRKGRRRAKRDGKTPAQRRAMRNNQRRVEGERGRKLQRRRSEVVERSFAHVCRTGGSRRSWLRGLDKVQKRYLMAAAARNLGLLMLKLFKIGKPKTLQGMGRAALGLLGRLLAPWRALVAFLFAAAAPSRPRTPPRREKFPGAKLPPLVDANGLTSTGC